MNIEKILAEAPEGATHIDMQSMYWRWEMWEHGQGWTYCPNGENYFFVRQDKKFPYPSDCVALSSLREIQRLRAENEALKKELWLLVTAILWHHTRTAFVPLSLAEEAKEIKERFFEADKGE